MQQPLDVFAESRMIEKAMKMGYTWFDMMYPRGSDAEARELKIGKYATVNSLASASTIIVQNDRLTGKKRKRIT